MTYKLSTTDLPNEIATSKTNQTRQILQNVLLILNTRAGTVPLHRDFGLPQAFIGKPMPVAETILYLEVKEALEAYESRAELVDVSFSYDETEPGRMIPVVEVEINEE